MKIAFLLLQALAVAQGPVFRSDTNIVEVAIVARDAKDSPVSDLKKSDFRLFDNGVEQKILSFERLGGIVATTRLPRERLSIILLDSLNTSWGMQPPARRAVMEMLEKVPHGPDCIAIFALGDDLRVLHDFSDDMGVLRAAVERYNGELTRNGVDDPVAPLAGHVTPPPTGGAPGARDSKLPVAPGFPLADPYRQVERLTLTVDALRAIARMMKDAPGEKNLLWVTAGFPPPDGTRQEIQSAMHALAAAKILLYPVDARGVLDGRGFANAQRLWEFAEQTGGRVFLNSNDTAGFLRSALEDSREGYVLTYAPRDYQRDGSAHLVRLRTSRKGVTLRYRPGYLADHR
jgi:VWFA-related protein